jgi:predicted phosphodiesterase
MKIMFIADLHKLSNYNTLINLLKNYNYDMIISLGDNEIVDLEYIEENMKDVPFYYVFGNHDLYSFKNYIRKGIDLHNKVISYNGLSFAGLEGIPRYNNNKNIPLHTFKEYGEYVKNMPYADFLISHMSYQFCKDKDADFNIHTNDEQIYPLLDYIKNKKPKYHVFGHYHSSSSYKTDNTTCICVYGVALLDTDTGDFVNYSNLK